MKAAIVSDMPKNDNNQFHSLTEDAALNYHNEKFWESDGKQRLLDRIQRIKSSTYELRQEVRKVELMLKSLTERERDILERYYFERETWPEVADWYGRNYKYMSVDTLMNMRNRAFTKLNKMLM